MTKNLLNALALAIATVCAPFVATADDIIATPPTPPRIDLLPAVSDLRSSASTTVIIAGRAVTFRVGLYRDAGNGDTSPLTASINASTRYRTGLPANLTFEKIRVTNKRTVWEASIDHLGVANSALQIFGQATGGPDWDVGTKCSIVLTYRVGTNRRTVTLRNVPIGSILS